MWRALLFICFFCSVALNVYLLMQLNVESIEKKFQQKVSIPAKSPPKKQPLIFKDTVVDETINTINAEATSTVKKAEVDNKNAEDNLIAQQVMKIKKAITDNDFFIASSLINTLANNPHANTELTEIKQFWLDVTKALILEDSFAHAENSISAYLGFQQDDIDFLYQQINLYWQQQLPIPAIRYAYEMQYHVFTEVQKYDVLTFARDLVQQHADLLIKNNLWLELRDLVEQVMILDPEDFNLQWLFVNAQYQLGEFEFARDAIAPFLNNPNYKVKAETLLAKIEAALRKPESIPLERQGEHFIVPAYIDGGFQVSLMLDTGASISLLSEVAFEGVKRYTDVTFLKELQLNTAGGQVIASMYQVAEFSIQGYIVKDFTFVVSPYISENNDGLLGMNFLSVFDFHIDQANSQLILKNKL
ncbi:retropepsin-like aspartic protease [Colwellia sp. E2M01]|uniref:retropepsin-like aspartic protease family protein n=1 Tax=Colwellia sp. E2M01 TaxID=2841561 RepID=UPI001C08EA62|nr:retropepsin-like aspartic protease [Colwellia sp. E2M01]MBU2871767.1 retroviral-like aspartic protease family protein [Colwellia sp. E2M01]